MENNTAIKYGIANNQIYLPADGSEGGYKVLDCETYAANDDVVVECLITGDVRRIDAYKLAVTRYFLHDERKENSIHNAMF